MRETAGAKPQTKDSLLFLLVCAYWLSQAFLIPLAPVGPSWAVWPTLSDFTVLGMVLLVKYRPLVGIHNCSTRTVLKFAGGIFFICVASFAIATAFYGSRNDLVTNGAYQIYRLLQFLVVLLATAQIAMTLSRWKVFRFVALITFCLISAGVLLTASGLVDTGVMTPLLPLNPEVSGAWSGYVQGTTPGGGFISFNHGYTGIQLILSAGAAYHCFEQSKRVRLLICVLLLLCTFASESRAGLIVAFVLVIALEWGRTKSNLFALILICALGGLWAIKSLAVEEMVVRQTSSVSSAEDDGLSGRTGIWQDHLDYFTTHPLNALIGTGYGYAGKASSSNAHNQYLHVMTETGLAGLLIFLYIQRRTLLLLRGPLLKTMRLTVWALLISGLTQETLYPVVAFSHFLGFYLSALVMALRFAGNFEVTLSSFTQNRPVNSVT